MTPTRSEIASASSWSCVTNSVVVPTSSWIRRISSRSWTRTLASSAESGSSRSRTDGSMASARARATRCCCPPESWLAYRLANSARPTSSSISRALRATFRRVDTAQLESELHVLLRRHVREEAVGLEHHAHVALVGRDEGDVLVAHDTRPESGSSRPATMRRAVVLPQPDGPSRATSSPGGEGQRRARPAPRCRRTSGAAPRVGLPARCVPSMRRSCVVTLVSSGGSWAGGRVWGRPCPAWIGGRRRTGAPAGRRRRSGRPAMPRPRPDRSTCRAG